MPIVLTSAAKNQIRQKNARLASLWRVTRLDGTIFRYTDHNSSLLFDGETFVPAVGFEDSAREYQQGLKSRDLEIIGVLSAGAITDEDLRSGKFRGATFEEIMVDWKFPFTGSILTRKFEVLEIQFNEQRWVVQLGSLVHRLSATYGRSYTKTCRHRLGDDKCTVNLVPYTQSGKTVTAIVTANRIFETDLVQADDYFNDGVLTWTSGDNNGVSCGVRGYVNTDGVVELHLETPLPVQVGDDFTITVGCLNTVESCKGTTGTEGKPWTTNILNYGGFPTIIGTDSAFDAPAGKA